MADKKTITRQDLIDAIRQCELKKGKFDVMDIWNAVLNPKKNPLDNEETQSDCMFDIGSYKVCKLPSTGIMIHITIKRKDNKPLHNWRDIQQIKNEICGEEAEACELYPAQSRLVDESNIYHIFALPKGTSFPFGMEKSEDDEK